MNGGARRPVVLCVLDGWGHREGGGDNATAPANAPAFARLWRTCPRALLSASGADVGLPEGQMGNSEVGHLVLGAGRVVLQDICRIDAAIADGGLRANPALARLTAALARTGGTCHLAGLLSEGGVHSRRDHIAELAAAVAGRGIPVAVHGFLDGRDTPPASAEREVAAFERRISGLPGAAVATLCGRYYAMDRDTRWDRVERACDLLVSGRGAAAPDALSAVRASYGDGVTDEFVAPVAIGGYGGMRDGDGLLMANFRADRVRQILLALLREDFDGFARRRRVAFAGAAGVVEYSPEHARLMEAMFPPVPVDNGLGRVVSDAGLRQLRIAETEKYAHVTYFFNGGEEAPLPGEDRVLVPSPRVATYDLRPEMSAREVTDRLVSEIAGGGHDLAVVNYANPDMVGHTGVMEAAVRAVRAVDGCVARLAAAVGRAGGALLVTADHGNAEAMRDPATGEARTAHTLNPVPVLLVNGPGRVGGLRDGGLADVAPTVLDLMGLAPPAEMTGGSLLLGRDPAAGGPAAGA